MADISKLSRLVAGVQRQVDLSTNALVVGSLKVGGSVSNTELTKTILDELITNSRTFSAGDGLSVTDGGAGGDVQYAVDASVVRNTSDQTMNSHKITNLADPTSNQDAATKAYVDSHAGTASSAIDNAFTINNASDATKQIAFDASGITTGNKRTIAMPDSNVNLGLIATAIQSSEKGASNGVATLDSGGKVPVSQLPNSVMEFKGSWDASTNTPTLADGTGNVGDVYRASVAGTQDLGSGPQTFGVGDWVMYNGSIWQHSPATDAVTSVNTKTGAVTLTTDDIGEGSTNKYFTDNRAKDAAGASATDTATIDFTYDSGTHQLTADVKDNSLGAAKLTTGAFDQTTITGGNGTPASVVSAPALAATMVAGESFAANTLALVRMAIDDLSETVTRVYKADNDASTSNKWIVVGYVYPGSSVSAGDNIVVNYFGTATGSFSNTDIGKEVFLGSSGAAIMGSSLTGNTNEAQVKLGVVQSVGQWLFTGAQLRGIA